MLGLCLLCLTMISWEIVLSKGQEWDWLGDPFFRVQTLLALFAFGLFALVCASWASGLRSSISAR